MKVLFVGLGSIGTRHLNNLFSVTRKMNIEITVDALRSSSRELPDDINKLISKQIIGDRVDDIYDVIFITNPTALHFDTIKKLANNGKAFFIEKPIFSQLQDTAEGAGLSGKIAYIAAPMRWCGVYLALKKELVDKNPYSARILCSSYLPEWRPNVDYRKVYSASRELGGGVTIDLIHEIDYMVDLFGYPLEMHNFKGTYSQLEIDSDDISIYIARYKNMLAEIHLDYFGRQYRRSAEFFVQDGTITADFGAGTLTLTDGSVLDLQEEVNERYIREMEYFLELLQNNKESINSAKAAVATLKLTMGEV